MTLTLDLPDDALGSPEQFAAETRLAAAVRLYDAQRVSQGRAAELAGLSRAAFIRALGDAGVSPLQETPEDLSAPLGPNGLDR